MSVVTHSRLAWGRVHYAWVIAAVTFLVIVITAGVRAAPGVLIVPLEEEFHWSRATISFAVGVNLLLYGAIGPFAAALMDRFGVRRVMTLAVLISALGGRLEPADARSRGSLSCCGASSSGSARALSAPISPRLSPRAGSAPGRGW